MRVSASPFRLLRTVLVGATIVGLAAGAHLAAGGHLPAPGIMAALVSLHVLCSTVATTFRLTLPVMTGLLATSQLVLHQAFDSLSVGIAAPAAGLSAGGTMSGHSMASHADPALLLHAAASLAPAGHADTSGWMLAAHVGATLATAFLLARGEAALWALAAWLRPLCRGAAVVAPLPARQSRPPAVPAPLPRLPWGNIRPDTRRGPPSARAVLA
ncbi:hypothetical protein [Specibacter sp. RAF43]|uniref:hypothetical protein n=1 Tax=Specibacter sp. RAF43 TaxID=3233057 RepID=UPI003F9597C3